MNQSTQPLLAGLLQNAEKNLDLVVTDARPFTGMISVSFTSLNRTNTLVVVAIQLKILRPVLELYPPSLSISVVKGEQRALEVKLLNSGEVIAKNVKVELPNERRLSIVSFSTSNQTSSALDGTDLPAGAMAAIWLTITIASDETLGEMTGRIAINSDLTSATLRYTFYIVSIKQINLSFEVKDQYTYYASGSPLVQGAEVRLSNPRQRFSEVRHTNNDTGNTNS